MKSMLSPHCWVVPASATFQIMQKALPTTSESACTWASGVGLHEGTSCQHRKRSSLASLSICCVLLKPGSQTDVFPGNTLSVSPCQTHQSNLFLPVRLWWLPTMSQLTYLKSLTGMLVACRSLTCQPCNLHCCRTSRHFSSADNFFFSPGSVSASGLYLQRAAGT